MIEQIQEWLLNTNIQKNISIFNVKQNKRENKSDITTMSDKEVEN